MLALSACSSVSRQPDRGAAAKVPPAARGGGYYLDDGPGGTPPVDLDSVPDAVPKNEPLHRGASRPYSVMGRDYTPMTAVAPYRARGIATWYGRRYHGKTTSTGEPYDMYAMTAAHTTLPLPSYARVTNLANGRSVIVRVNDRGPFIGERLIDLSYVAAHKLGVLAAGSAMVEVESITPGFAPPLIGKPATPAPLETAREPEPPAPSSPARAASTSVPEVPILSDGAGVFVQLAAFGSQENADNFLARLTLEVDWLSDRLQVLPRDGLYRVRAGPYANAAEARRAADRISETLGIKPLVTPR